jgi:hypothetical protein
MDCSCLNYLKKHTFDTSKKKRKWNLSSLQITKTKSKNFNSNFRYNRNSKLWTLLRRNLRNSRYNWREFCFKGKLCNRKYTIVFDTGLEVEALNGAPGVFSARYAGEQRSAADNMDKLLQVLSNQSNRNAQFKTVVTLNLNGKQYLFTGIARARLPYPKSEKKVSATILSTWRISTNFRWIVVWIKKSDQPQGKATQQLISFWKREVSYQIWMKNLRFPLLLISPTLYPQP